MSEDPPGDGDHPHDNEHHNQNVIQKTATELAQATRGCIAAMLIVLDPSKEFSENYSDKQDDCDSYTTKDKKPGHVRLCRAVRIFFAWNVCF